MEINISQLSMTYKGGKRALDGINLNLKSPSLVGLLGPNGAGKTTLMKLLVAALLPTEGEIFFDGKPLQKCEHELKQKLGYLPQSFGLYDELTVWQYLDYMAALKGIKNAKQAINYSIEAANLEQQKKTTIRKLSGGQRQRVGIAQALLGDPPFMIFDEPTVGLDPEERIHFRNLFSKSADDKLVLLSTHIIEDVQSVCNQLIVINKGKILFTGTPEELIRLAHGHIAVFMQNDVDEEYSGLHITSRINTANGILCRGVCGEIPSFAKEGEPTLEDAYMYLITNEGAVS